MACDDHTEQASGGIRGRASVDLRLVGDRPTAPGGGPVVVTGAAGFIGSHLVEHLAGAGHRVRGLDSFDPWYDPAAKRANLTAVGVAGVDRHGADGIERSVERHVEGHLERDVVVEEVDLVEVGHEALVERLDGAAVVHHLAGRPGVQSSWGRGFEATARANVLATQHLLEAALAAGVGRVVLASSSSVYGDGGPVGSRAPAPISPYGVSKLAAEQLAAVYGARGLPVVTLRYFTVYGPRQRPDMAIHRLFAAALGGPVFPLRGSGEQRRQFTFVDDVVAATAAAGSAPLASVAGAELDIGGGSTTSLNEVIELVAELTGRRPPLRPEAGPPGDPRMTEADLAPAERRLGWRPTTGLADGLARQWDWQRARPAHRSAPAGSVDSVGSTLLVDGAAG